MNPTGRDVMRLLVLLALMNVGGAAYVFTEFRTLGFILLNGAFVLALIDVFRVAFRER